MKDIKFYGRRFLQLRVDRSRGAAPHKPILLLSVIELIEQKLLQQNHIALSPELIAAFLKYWTQLGSDNHNADIALPFFHLKSEGFWHLQAKPGFDSVLDTSNIRLKTIAAINSVVAYASFDDELFDLLLDPTSRQILVQMLIETWFKDKTEKVVNLIRVNSFGEYQEQLQKQGGAIYTPIDLQNEAVSVVRDAAFRRIIISIYEQRCAFCHLRVLDSFGQNIVDGAHIKPFAKFFDDRVDNGLSLCKNHHWAFDQGWFTVGNNFQIVVADNLMEDAPNAKTMAAFQGESLLFPVQEKYRPRLESLEWHRKNVFRKSGV